MSLCSYSYSGNQWCSVYIVFSEHYFCNCTFHKGNFYHLKFLQSSVYTVQAWKPHKSLMRFWGRKWLVKCCHSLTKSDQPDMVWNTNVIVMGLLLYYRLHIWQHCAYGNVENVVLHSSGIVAPPEIWHLVNLLATKLFVCINYTNTAGDSFDLLLMARQDWIHWSDDDKLFLRKNAITVLPKDMGPLIAKWPWIVHYILFCKQCK